MSRGLGKIQRDLLEVMELNAHHPPNSSLVLAGLVFFTYSVSDAQLVSVRRALRKLAKGGLVVDLGRRFRKGARYWALPQQAEVFIEREVAFLRAWKGGAGGEQ